MIYIIAGVLAVVLLLLFIDWSALLHRFDAARDRRRTPTRRQSDQVLTGVPDLDETPLQPLPEVEPVQKYDDPELERLLAEADVHFRKNEFKAAEEFYLKAAAKDPRCSKAYSRLGVIYLEEGDNWEDAEEAFRQALKTEPENGFILNNLGLVLYHQDKFADAIRNFEAAVRQDELNASRHSNLGMGYMAIRQYAKAESSFKKALKLAPNEMEYKDLLSEAIDKKQAHKTMVRR